MPRSPADSAAAPPGALHPVLARVFAAWDRQGLDWCLLRMPADPCAPEGDIDLLVDPASLEVAAALAAEHDFARLPDHRSSAHLIAYHRETGVWLWLHCVTELGFGPYQALRGDPASAVLRRRVRGSPARPAPDDELWITLAHCLLERGGVPPKHRSRLAALAPEARTDSAIATGLDDLLSPGSTSAALLRACQREDWAALNELAPALIRGVARRARPGLGRRAATAVWRLPGRVSQARHRRGISVALLGPDGAGKSTLAVGIERGFVFPVRRVYMGLTAGMLQHIDRLRIPGVVRLGRLAVIWARYLRARYHMARGRLVVFDRYVYDAGVPTPYRLSWAARLGRWIDGRSCPPPDLIVLLDAPGRVMHQRKAEYDPEMLEDWRRHFLALQRRFPGMEVVDSTRPIETVRADVIDRVWRRYARRWRRP
jgi:thymidylate kinase